MSKTIYVPVRNSATDEAWLYDGVAFTSKSEAEKYIDCNDEREPRLFEFMLFEDSDDNSFVSHVRPCDVLNLTLALESVKYEYGTECNLYQCVNSTIEHICNVEIDAV